MIYKLGRERNPFEDNPGLSLIPEFEKLTASQFLFVCLVCDPSRDNPVRTLAGRERRYKAAEIAGFRYEPDGKRLDKNARNAVYGKIPSIEAAIETFKGLHYNSKQRSIDALKQQIHETREFLTGEKRIPMVKQGKIIVDQEGKEVYITDQKALKLAMEIGPRLADMEEALEKLETANKLDDTAFEDITFTASDLDENEYEEDDIPAIEKLMGVHDKRNVE